MTIPTTVPVLSDKSEAFLSGSHTTLAFSVLANVPGALVKPLQVFANEALTSAGLSRVPPSDR